MNSACILIPILLFVGQSPAVQRVDRYGDPLPQGAVARLGTKQLQHTRTVRALMFSPDDKQLASCGDDHTVRLWNPATGKLLFNCQGHVSPVNAVAFSLDGKQLASASADGTLRLWSATSGKQIHHWWGHSKKYPLNSVAFHADGKHLVTTGVLRYGDSRHGPEGYYSLLPLDRNDPVKGYPVEWFGLPLAVSADGRQVTFDRCLWDVGTRDRLFSLLDLLGMPTCATFSADGRYLATGRKGTNILLSEMASGQPCNVLMTRDPVFALSPDGRTLASGAFDGTVRVWDLATRTVLRELHVHENAISALAFSRDGRTLASGSNAGTIRLWDVATGKEKGRRQELGKLPGPLVFLDGGRTLLVQSWAQVQKWDVATQQPVGKPFPAFESLSLNPAGGRAVLSPDKKLLAIAERWRNVALWNLETGERLHYVGRHPNIHGVAFAPDGKTLAVHSENVITIWDAATGLELLAIDDREWQEWYPTYTADGKKLITLSYAKQAILFRDSATGKVLRSVPAERPPDEDSSSRGEFLTLSPSGRIFAGSNATRLDLRSVTTGRPFHWEGSVFLFTFSPDGKILATSAEKDVDLWELATGQKITTFKGHDSDVIGLAFAPDGNVLASGSMDNTILLWDVRPGHVLNRGKLPELLTAEDLQGCWAALAQANAGAAYEAIGKLVINAKVSVPFLGERLKPAPALPPGHVEKLIADLDAKEFAVREKAFAELKKLGNRVERALLRKLEEKISLELRRRIEQLLPLLPGREVNVPPGEALRMLRAIQTLEAIGNAEGRAVLERLAAGDDEATVTQDARLALERLKRRGERAGWSFDN